MKRAVAYEAEGKAPWLFLLLAIALMAGMAYFMGDRPLTVPFLNVTATIAVFLTFVPIAWR